MASLAEHLQECQAKLGNPFEEVNYRLDQFAHWPDEASLVAHRKFLHHQEGIDYITQRYGPVAGEAARLHVLRDCGHIPRAQDYYTGVVTSQGLPRSTTRLMRREDYPQYALTTPDLLEYIPLLHAAVVETQAQVVVDLGTGRGESARIFAKALEQTHGILTSLEVAHHIESEAPWVERFRTTYPQHQLLHADSLTHPWSTPIDVLFIDTSHHYAATCRELVRFGLHVVPGGRILLHDTQHRNGAMTMGLEVTRAIQEFTWIYNLSWMNHPGQWGMGEIRIPKTPVPAYIRSWPDWIGYEAPQP